MSENRDFAYLEPTEHMLRWLSDEPYAAIGAKVEDILNQQVPGSQLLAFRVTAEPQWLTAARPDDDDPSQVILVRTGVAFPFALTVREPTGPTHELAGVYSWVGVHLDDPDRHRQRIWFDLGASLEQCGSQGELQHRLYWD